MQIVLGYDVENTIMLLYVSISINLGPVVKHMHNKNNSNVVKGLKYVDFTAVFPPVWMWINLSTSLKPLKLRNIADMHLSTTVAGHTNVWPIGMLQILKNVVTGNKSTHSIIASLFSLFLFV